MRVWQECDSTLPPMVQCKHCVHLSENRWCKKVNAQCRPDDWNHCRFFKQKTNADKIRSMSDKEMAEAMSEVDVCPPRADRILCGDREGCKYCWLDHLREPAEEEL